MKSEVVPSRVFFLGLLFFFFVRCLPSSTAFNITDILAQQPDFSSFNDALTQTQVASLINSRQSLTILALDNGAVSGLPSSQDALRAVLSLHVILDYFDLQKLQNMAQKSTILTTLYQTTGQANGMQGFLNVTVTNAGVMIGSAVPGSSLGSSLVKLVTSQPYNISVLQVSSAIVPPGVGGGNTNSSTSPPSPPGASSPPASSPRASPIIPLPPKFGNAPVPSAANSPNGSPSNASATPPSASAAGSPSNASATPPSAGGAGSPSNASATPPSAGGATPPSGPPSAGGAMSPSGASAMPPSGGGGILPGNASAPSNAGAATPAGATAPSGASADSPAGATPGNVPIGSPPMPVGASPVADGPVADAPAPTVGTSAARRSYQSLDHASVLIMSLVVIWSIGQLT